MDKLIATAILAVGAAYCLAGLLGMVMPWDGSLW